MSTEYYQKNKEKLWKEAHERYQTLSEEERNWGKNMVESNIKLFLKKKKEKKHQYEHKH